MNTLSHSASSAPAARANEIRTSLRLLVVGALCGLATWSSIPRMTRYWTQTAAFVEQLHVQPAETYGQVPYDAPARQLAGWNHR